LGHSHQGTIPSVNNEFIFPSVCGSDRIRNSGEGTEMNPLLPSNKGRKTGKIRSSTLFGPAGKPLQEFLKKFRLSV
jgi:hypothetical protein